MRTANLLLAGVASAVLAGGCVAGLAMLEPQAFVILGAAPADGATAWEGRDVTVSVQDPGHLLTEEGRADLVTHVFIQTWPEGTPIPVTAEAVPGPIDWQWGIRVTPAVSLDDRWYVVGVSDLPGRTLLNAKLPDGTFGARFRPGSHPRVANLQFCDDPPQGMKVVVTFSEPVSSPADAANLVSVDLDGRLTTCASASADATVLAFTCAELSAGASVSVALAAGLAGAGGTPVEAGSWPMQIAQLPRGGCQAFAPPL